LPAIGLACIHVVCSFSFLCVFCSSYSYDPPTITSVTPRLLTTGVRVSCLFAFCFALCLASTSVGSPCTVLLELTLTRVRTSSSKQPVDCCDAFVIMCAGRANADDSRFQLRQRGRSGLCSLCVSRCALRCPASGFSVCCMLVATACSLVSCFRAMVSPSTSCSVSLPGHGGRGAVHARLVLQQLAHPLHIAGR
jgi:hypothetical protein